MFHADVRTDITKATVAFRDFANPPKKGTSVSYTAPNTPHYGCKDNRAPHTPYYALLTTTELQTLRTIDETSTHRPIPESGFIISLV